MTGSLRCRNVGCVSQEGVGFLHISVTPGTPKSLKAANYLSKGFDN